MKNLISKFIFLSVLLCSLVGVFSIGVVSANADDSVTTTGEVDKSDKVLITQEEEDAFLGNGNNSHNDNKSRSNIFKPTKVDISGNLVAGYNTLSEEVDVTQMNLAISLEFGDRLKAVIDLDGRAAAGQSKIKERLRLNPQFRASVSQAVQYAIAARLGVSPSEVVVPDAVLNSAVNSAVDDIVDQDAITESTIRQLYVAVEVYRTDDMGLTFTVGKMDPIYYNENLYGHFATSNPAVRVTLEYKAWSVSVSAYNNRYGENWSLDGTTVAQIQNLVQRAGQNKLEYDPNSYEVLVSKLTKKFGEVIVAVGTRENGIQSSDKSTYTLVQINPELGTFRISMTGSREDFDRDSLEVPGGGTRTRFTTEVSKPINEDTTAYAQGYYGNQTGVSPNRQRALVIGLERIFFTRKSLNAGARVSVFTVENKTARGKTRENGLFTGFVVRWK